MQHQPAGRVPPVLSDVAEALDYVYMVGIRETADQESWSPCSWSALTRETSKR
jgi:hypothetical protein